MFANSETRAPGLEQRLDEQPVLTPVPVSVLNQPPLFLAREALEDPLAGLHPLDA